MCIRDRISAARWYFLILMTITLIVLALEAVLIFAPVTRRIRHDMRTLEKKEEDMHSLFSGNPTAMLLVNRKDLAIIKANEKACDLLGAAAEEISRNDLRSYLDATSDTNGVFLDAIGKHEPLSSYEVVLLDAQRTEVSALASIREIDFAGQEVYLLGLTNICLLYTSRCV